MNDPRATSSASISMSVDFTLSDIEASVRMPPTLFFGLAFPIVENSGVLAPKKTAAVSGAVMFEQAGALFTGVAASDEVEPPDFVQPLKFSAFLVKRSCDPFCKTAESIFGGRLVPDRRRSMRIAWS
jgi:hypothetical protein